MNIGDLDLSGEPDPKLVAWRALDAYQSAGLATRYQEGIISSWLWPCAYDQRAADVITAATKEGKPLTPEQVQSFKPSAAMSDDDRYILLFGQGEDVNKFAIPPGNTEYEALTAAAIARGSRITPDEVTWLNRSVLPNAVY